MGMPVNFLAVIKSNKRKGYVNTGDTNVGSLSLLAFFKAEPLTKFEY